MLIGVWKNIKEMEEELNLPEIEKFVAAAREREERGHRFMAALKGIDLDDRNDAVDIVAQKKQEMEARRLGKTVDQMEFEELGMEVETEED